VTPKSRPRSNEKLQIESLKVLARVILIVSPKYAPLVEPERKLRKQSVFAQLARTSTDDHASKMMLYLKGEVAHLGGTVVSTGHLF
jgi:hypothetical protein